MVEGTVGISVSAFAGDGTGVFVEQEPQERQSSKPQAHTEI